MKITAVDTIQVAAYSNIVWVEIHTDEGIVGLGETFRNPQAVVAYIHETCAPYLLGKDPLLIEQHWDALHHRVGNHFNGYPTRSIEIRGNSAVDIALWDIFGKSVGQPVSIALGGKARDTIRTYNTCAGYRYIRDSRSQAVANWHVGEQGGPYEDLEGFLYRADELAHSLLEQGITGMKIWPFDIAAERLERGVQFLWADVPTG